MLISKFPVPVLRRTLQAILVWDHGFTVQQATASHKYLDTRDAVPRIFRAEMPFTGQQYDNVVFKAGREPSITELNWLGQLILLQRQIISNKRLGEEAERYMRAWIVKSKLFDRVTPESDLGRVAVPGTNKTVDIAATEIATGTRYVISVKNYNGPMLPNHVSIAQLQKCARQTGAHPWLVVPYAFEETISRCSMAGIRLTGLGSQIAPQSYEQDGRVKRMNAAIKKLRPVVGPQPYELIGQRADRADFSKVRDYLPSIAWLPNA